MRTAVSTLFTFWPPLPPAAEGVDLEILFVDCDDDVVVEFGHDIHAGEGRVARLLESKGEMRTRRCTPRSAGEVAEGEFARDLEGGTT